MDDFYNDSVTYEDFIQEDTASNPQKEPSFTGQQHTVELLSAAIPYLDVKSKHSLSCVMKATELMESLHNLGTQKDVSACGMDDFKLDFEGLLLSIRKVSYDAERNIIDQLLNFMRAKNVYQTFQTISAFAEASNPGGKTGDNSSGNPFEMMDLLKTMLPPEQQSSMENISTLISAMNLMNNNN